MFDEGNPVAGDLHFAQQVRVEEHRRPALAQFVDHVAHQAPSNRVEPRGGLVQKDQAGLVEQRLGQADALQHALGKRAQLLVRRKGVSPTRSSSSATALRERSLVMPIELARAASKTLRR